MEFIQINLNRCHAAHDLLLKNISENNIDIVIGQEPNKKRCVNYFCDKNCDSFIDITGKQSVISCFSEIGFVCVELECCYVYSCYFSPNGNTTDFEELLHSLGRHLRKTKDKGKIVAGDLNAKTKAIGSRQTNERGKMLEDWLMSNDLIVLNEGDKPTFVGEQGTSIVDFTAVTPDLAGKVRDWKVEDEAENMSDHCSITFKLGKISPEADKKTYRPIRYKVSRDKLVAFSKGLQDIYRDTQIAPKELIDKVAERCKKYFGMPNTKNSRRTPVYWWNEEIGEKRKTCIQLRRRKTRLRKLNPADNTWQEADENYKEAKKSLKKEIDKAKREKWRDLCEELNDDIWGKAYKIVTRKLKLKTNKEIPPDIIREQIEKLFPKRARCVWEDRETEEELHTFSEGELEAALEQLKNKKAAGPDGITPEIIKASIRGGMQSWLSMYNNCLIQGIFPKIWKMARLVLLEKPKKKPTFDLKTFLHEAL